MAAKFRAKHSDVDGSLKKTALQALGLWCLGFVWGLVVFMVPALADIPAIRYVSKFPAVSFVLLPLYAALIYLFSRNTPETPSHFGAVFFMVNFLLDVLVYVFVFRSQDYFAYGSIWLSYALMFAMPRLAAGKTTRR